MSSEVVITEIDHKGIARVILNRPSVHNAFDDSLVYNLNKELCELDRSDDVRVIILSGNGKSFCAGADLKWMQRMINASKEENRDDAIALALLLVNIWSLSKPTVSLVHGSAFGGGVGLIAATDIAICTEGTIFAISEARVGLIPSTISPFVINAIGESHAKRYFLTGEKFNATKALDIGLVHEVVPEGNLKLKSEQIVESLIKCGPNAQREAKRLFGVPRELLRDPNLSAEITNDLAERIAELRVSVEGQEGIKAFLEKRKPSWSI